MGPEQLIFLIPIVAIICGTIVTLAKNSQTHKVKHGANLSDEEAKIMQGIHQSLDKMEKRVEALETIIINKK